ncbi:hypothetical protein ACYJ1Y_06965 [Natrialbaceae archaeon A-gly3]
MSDGRTRRVFREMLREEWRLHTHLFGGPRFGLFPVVIAALTAGTVGVLTATGTGTGSVFAGLHALAFVFGLHTGSIGFVGRDALQDLLGDLTLIVFSARTLPLSRERLLAVFVLKDVVYYAGLFLLPIAVGTVPAILEGHGAGTPAVVGTVLVLWTTLTAMFVLGIGTTLTGLGVSRYGTSGPVLLIVLAGAAGAAWLAGVDLIAYSPYGVFLEATPLRIGATTALLATVFLVAAVTFDVDGSRPARTVGPSFRRWVRRLGDPVATKTILDVHRSSGGFGKVLFSAAVLFGVTAGLVALAERITGVSPSVGISFGTILGLSGFTTYNWLTQFDDVDSYRLHPLSVLDVLEAKFRAFLALGPLVGLGFYALAVSWHGGPVLEAVVGAVLLVGVACYIFGTTVYLTGLSPNEFLFDTPRFAVFAIAVIVPLVPILVVAFALAPVAVDVLVTLGVVGLAIGVTGLALYRRSLAKWSSRYRRG